MKLDQTTEEHAYPLPDFMYRIIGQNIRAERKVKQYSQEDFAKMLNMNINMLDSMENGKMPIDPAQLMIFARALEVEPEELLDKNASIYIGAPMTGSNAYANNSTVNIGISEESLNNLTSALNRMCDLLEKKLS